MAQPLEPHPTRNRTFQQVRMRQTVDAADVLMCAIELEAAGSSGHALPLRTHRELQELLSAAQLETQTD